MINKTYKPTFSPWNPQMVEALNFGQMNPQFHPYTCPGNYPECKINVSWLLQKMGGFVSVASIHRTGVMDLFLVRVRVKQCFTSPQKRILLLFWKKV